MGPFIVLICGRWAKKGLGFDMFHRCYRKYRINWAHTRTKEVTVKNWS